MMRVLVCGSDLGVVCMRFKDFRKLARRLKLKYRSLEEGSWIEVEGNEDTVETLQR